jgi:hypothetical protein
MSRMLPTCIADALPELRVELQYRIVDVVCVTFGRRQVCKSVGVDCCTQRRSAAIEGRRAE